MTTAATKTIVDRKLADIDALTLASVMRSRATTANATSDDVRLQRIAERNQATVCALIDLTPDRDPEMVDRALAAFWDVVSRPGAASTGGDGYAMEAALRAALRLPPPEWLKDLPPPVTDDASTTFELDPA